MKKYPTAKSRLLVGTFLTVCAVAPPATVQAQSTSAEPSLEEIVVTGSRIRRDPLNEIAPIMNIGIDDIDQTGVTNLGAALQQLPITGSAVNTRFNVPGNSGFPQDGSGIGAGAVQLSLRNIGAKRTLILVDGRRWIAGASASGVPSVVDMNTIPANMIQRIEILQDGASAIYGSDAIGGVVNVITNKNFDGLKFDYHIGQYLGDGDGQDTDFSALWGGGNDDAHFVFSASYTEEGEVLTSDRARSAFPVPDTTSCDVSGTRCSSFTPQGRFILGPNLGGSSLTLNQGALNDGGANVPAFDPNNPTAGDFSSFTSADRFNYNGPGFNYLRTPSERVNLFTHVDYALSEDINLFARASYTNRTSDTRGAPEPLCLGNDCGNAILNNFFISADNPYNPFGADLSVANGNLDFFGRRPLESGPRLFYQDVDTFFVSTGLEGKFGVGDRSFYWDATLSYGDNQGFQEKENSHNAARLQVAMGDPSVCAATPNCVPFNFFGGQGPDGNGSITQEMLDFVTYTQRDFSEQTLEDFAFNISGDIASLPAGELAFAAGFEYRDHQGAFRPDPIAARGETAGIPSGATSGAFDVTEVYGELNVPLIADASFAKYLELNVAVRSSDYSTSGSEGTYKAGLLWQVNDALSLRSSLSTGLRAPGIGELFGGAARADFTFLDPCADYLGQLGSNNGGRDAAQSQTIISNCAALGVPAGTAQTNPQLSAVSAGNANLKAETSESLTAGIVFNPNVDWAERFTASLDFYDLEIDDAIQGIDPGDLINACVNTGDPFFCSGIERGGSGRVNLVNNQLQNIGGIEASGADVMFNFHSNANAAGQFTAKMNATFLDKYIERTANPDGSETINDRTGTHTDETFERAFPELRATTTLGWNSNANWNGSVSFRYTDSMETASGETLDSALFTDVQFSFIPPIANDSVKLTVGLNNAFDEDPPVLDTSLVGLSLVSHDIPGRVGYLRISYTPQ
ncbi:TonB-dependent receptor plug domain-containing protein [Arenicella xantha]|uniref:Iron complex outermembrane receptor protein n=1 Tax=Arenicella xantha TaxID=644221 RepID=A0A395JNJ3_9GAMM|nr:TonB-dependent receptor [Arenicella xantha]RBP53179.1 iron complex outermembrane receptor protein [Arenicella xantha]